MSELKLNNKRTILVGLAFLSICSFWQMYDNLVPLILRETFHMDESLTGVIMAADNVLALFLLPFFGGLSDKTRTKLGSRTPYIIAGTAGAVILMNLLPALDSLDLAIQYGGNDEACKSLLTGVSMTRKLILDALKNHGFDVAGEVGEPFNPDVHEAVSYEDRDDMEPGCVSTLHQRGYRLKDRLLRPAKVSVSRKPA